MNPISSARAALRGLWSRHGDWRHGAQLAAVVVVSYLVSVAVGLPDGAWAVMSALIVMRPSAGLTLGAGWDRIRATVLGALAGLFGVWLEYRGVAAPLAMLSIVAMLAYASAAGAAWRSAPIAAVIVLSSGAHAGHSALQVAALRVVQIGIGVGVALAISLLSSRLRSGPRFKQGCAMLLRGLALHVGRPTTAGGAQAEKEAEKEAASARLRTALDRLALLAESVDRESRLFGRVGRKTTIDSQHYRHMAQLVGRVLQDVAVLGRILQIVRQNPAGSSGDELVRATQAALAGSADAVAGVGPPEPASLGPLRESAARLVCAAATSPGLDILLSGPLRLLAADLECLCRKGASG